MSLWLVLPVKPFLQGKSRLSAVLDDQTRVALNRALMMHVLSVAVASKQLAGVTVVSRDPEALTIAHSHAVHGLQEQKHDLNSALMQGCKHAAVHRATSLLILPTDLPLLALADFERLLQYSKNPNSMVIAPSPDGGTNALLLNPINAIPFQFGRNSFEHHIVAACKAQLSIYTVASPGLQTDIDMPQDLLNLPPTLLATLGYSASLPQALR